jgi:hypothetical protein
VVLSPPISSSVHRPSALQMRTKCCEFHDSVLTTDGQSHSTHLIELSPRVADLSGAQNERTFFSRRTSNLARGSDADCLIRQCLKFCQRRTGFSGSLLEKTPNLCGIRETKGDCGHALAIGELAHAASITIAKIDIFRAVCLQSGRIFFSSAEETSDHDSLHTIGTHCLLTTYCTYSSPMIALEYGMARRLSACSRSELSVSTVERGSLELVALPNPHQDEHRARIRRTGQEGFPTARTKQ